MKPMRNYSFGIVMVVIGVLMMLLGFNYPTTWPRPGNWDVHWLGMIGGVMTGMGLGKLPPFDHWLSREE